MTATIAKVVPGALLALGLVLLLLGVLQLASAWTYSRWSTADGVIVSSAAERVGASAVSGPSRGSDWIPRVRYRFSANGRSYESEDLSNMPVRVAENVRTEKAPPRVQAVLDRYPVGRTVSVRYDAQHPERSFVEFKKPGVWLLLGGLLAVGLRALVISRL